MKVLVLGSGVIGLSTAQLIREELDYEVTIYSDKKIEETTSDGAGGLWMPFQCEPVQLVSTWSQKTYVISNKFLNIFLQKYLNERHQNKDGLVEKLVHREYLSKQVVKENDLPTWAKSLNLKYGKTSELKDVEIDSKLLENKPFFWDFDCFVIDTREELKRLYKQLQEDNKCEIILGTSLESTEDIKKLAKLHNCKIVINCTGLGALKILKDVEVMPKKGVTLVYKRPKCPVVCCGIEGGWISTSDKVAYGIPRGNVIIIGGSVYDNDFTTNVSKDDVDRLKKNAEIFYPQLKNQEPLSAWAGLRPFRKSGIRFDKLKLGDGISMVNNYGHGGSGWTVFFGAACANIQLVLSISNS